MGTIIHLFAKCTNGSYSVQTIKTSVSQMNRTASPNIISIYHQLLFRQYKESDYFDSYLDARLFTWTCKAMTELMMFFATTLDKVGVVTRRA